MCGLVEMESDFSETAGGWLDPPPPSPLADQGPTSNLDRGKEARNGLS